MGSRSSPLPRALAVALSGRHDRRHACNLPRLQRVGDAPRHRLSLTDSPLTILPPHFHFDVRRSTFSVSLSHSHLSVES